MNIVLANGDMKTIDFKSDLWWGMQGAGHNFGIVTSATTKVYDIEHPNWAIETVIFSGGKVEAVYEAANKHIVQGGKQSSDIINWSYWLNDATLDANKVRQSCVTRASARTSPLIQSACHPHVYHPRRS
jgi:glyceraldehyde-3-phosphate dehydrogenase/erythrose-4-phosphate dehydrogenase